MFEMNVELQINGLLKPKIIKLMMQLAINNCRNEIDVHGKNP